MAKVKAPLLSFGASGKIADTQVYFPWKGINAVRKHVIPANPKTDKQKTQRDLCTAAVLMVHTAMSEAANPLDSDDKSAYALWAAAQGIVMTWFNTFVRMYIKQHRLTLKAVIYRNLTVTPGTDKLTVTAQYTKEGSNDITAGELRWGISKTALINHVDCTGTELMAGKDTGTLVTGTKYYIQYWPTAHADFVGAKSGIAYGVPL